MAMTPEQAEWLARCPLGTTLKNRLRLGMLLAGVSHTAMIQLTGFRSQYISAVSTGDIAYPRADNAQVFARALGVDVEVIFPLREDSNGRSDPEDRSEDRGADPTTRG